MTESPALTQEMIDHILDTTNTAGEVIEKAFALGIDAGRDISRHAKGWENDKALRATFTTIKQQEKFMAQLSQLVFEHKSLDARMLCLDHGWCINCYTYTCHGDCG